MEQLDPFGQKWLRQKTLEIQARKIGNYLTAISGM